MKVHDGIGGRLREFLEAQPVFFVATAPSGGEGHVNVSPKGMTGTFLIRGEAEVAYLDYHGSGAETIAHLRENGRITLMFCAFAGPPTIVRLHGRGTFTPVTDERCAPLVAEFPAPPDLHAVRGVVTVEVTRVSDSCGFGYRETKNRTSIDGLPAYTRDLEVTKGG